MSTEYLNQRIETCRTRMLEIDTQLPPLTRDIDENAKKLAQVEQKVILSKGGVEELAVNHAELTAKMMRLETEIFNLTKRNNPDDATDIGILKGDQDTLRGKVADAKRLHESRSQELQEIYSEINHLRLPYEADVRMKEELLLEKEDLDKEIWRLMFARDVVHMNPEAILIDRYKPRDRTRGGLFKPDSVADQEARSSSWGRILRLGEGPTSDEDVIARREMFKPGLLVGFLATNPISGGFPGHRQLQMISIKDILISHTEANFATYVAANE